MAAGTAAKKRARTEPVVATQPSDEPRIEWVPLDELVRWPRNPKEHDLPALEASFRRFGFVDLPLVDEGTGRLVKGHGRVDGLEERKARGEPAPKRIRVGPDGRWIVPVVRGVRFDSEVEAEAYVIADNRHVELGGWNEEMLGAIFRDHLESSGDAAVALAGVGYAEEDAREMIELAATAALGPEQPTPPGSFPDFSPGNVKVKYCCPKCGYEWSGSPE